jgi:hypothetical protein
MESGVAVVDRRGVKRSSSSCGKQGVATELCGALPRPAVQRYGAGDMNRGIRILVRLLLSVALVFWLLIAPRLLAILFLLVVGVDLLLHHRYRHRYFEYFVWITLFLIPLSPVDVSLKVGKGLPHFAPVRYGLPTAEAWKAAERGEIVVGGCMPQPFAPKWVLIW